MFYRKKCHICHKALKFNMVRVIKDYVRFQVLMAVNMKITSLWDVMPCSQ
jgi:hypothetical protein